MTPSFSLETLENRQLLSVAAPVLTEVQPLNQPALTVKVAQPKLGSGEIAGERILTTKTVSSIAAKFLKSKKVNWGDPIKITKQHNGDYWVRYATPAKEVKLLSYRTVIVSPDRSVKFLPRR